MKKTVKLKVSGMHCSSCEKLIAMELEDLPGIISSKISAKDAEAVITADTSLKTEEIISTIKKAGYEAELIKE